ncbi:hypothetical protein E2C01_029951 [Portunus trituberculatus]|uniref:Uncharacterized protein n=1 Tax=Portunus trituberculatus TaxID=210409 RepID=A0A5B7EPN6_PORTR|nr:hypothetical protein [Portunus trituberculatus]
MGRKACQEWSLCPRKTLGSARVSLSPRPPPAALLELTGQRCDLPDAAFRILASDTFHAGFNTPGATVARDATQVCAGRAAQRWSSFFKSPRPASLLKLSPVCRAPASRDRSSGGERIIIVSTRGRAGGGRWSAAAEAVPSGE